MMERARIELESGTVMPFGKLEGKVVWQKSDRPSSLELRVFWTTEGRGTEEVNIASVVPGSLASDGTAKFTIGLPGTPWSFNGQIISVTWAVELVDEQGVACALQDFILSPDGRVRELGKVLAPKSKKKSFGFQGS